MKRMIDILSVLLLLAIGGDLIYLHARVRNSDGRTEEALASMDMAKSLPPGTTFLPMPAWALDGRSISVPAGRQRLIFFISTGCGACAKQMAEWSEVSHIVGRDQVLFLTAEGPATSTRTLPAYLAKYGVPGFPSASIDGKVMKKLSMLTVPRVVLVADDGRVRQAWAGRVTRETLLRAWRSH